MSKYTIEELIKMRDSGPWDSEGSEVDAEDRKLLSELRLLRLLATNDQEKPIDATGVDYESILKFLNEILPHDQMVDIENYLKSNPEDFDAFLNFRIESVANQLPDVPEDISNAALAAFVEPLKASKEQELSENELPPSATGLFSWASELFSNKLTGLIGAGAVAGITAFFIASIFLLNDSSSLNPILVADLGFDYKAESMDVITRGGEDLPNIKPKVIILASGDLDLSSKVREILISLDGEPRKETQAALLSYLKIEQNIDQLPYYIQIDKQVWSAVQGENKNLAYGEWALMTIPANYLDTGHSPLDVQDKEIVLLYIEAD